MPMYDGDFSKEKPKNPVEAAKWEAERRERIRRADEATKELKEECTAMFLENIRRARARMATSI